ncbi:MAG: helix-turn-helix transcriptional regulator [Myxococcaceae bacterium]
MGKDFLEEVIQRRTARNAGFPALVDEAEFRRAAAKKLVAKREKAGLSQTVVAAMMGTSASVVSKLESGADVKISTLVRYCQAIGASWEFSAVRRLATR